MSRMVELIQDEMEETDPRRLPVVLKALASKLDVETANLVAKLPLTFPVVSPASGRASYQPADLSLSGTISPDLTEVATSLTTQVTSLCPCSKAISDYGAHNQRSDVTVTVRGENDRPYPMSVLQLFEGARSVGSCSSRCRSVSRCLAP